MSGSDQTPARFVNYPTPKAHDAPYKAPPPGNNPVLTGWLLDILSYVVVFLPWVQAILWKNAGFSSLRECRQLDGVDARHDPTVIPLPQSNDGSLPSYTDRSTLRASPRNGSGGRFYSVNDFHDVYASGAITPTDVVEYLLPLIRRDAAQRSPRSLATAFMDSQAELIRKAAQASTQRWKTGQQLGVLDGVPFGVKDDLQVEGYKRYIGTTHDYSNGGETETSWCAKKVEEAGAVLVGTLTMHEMGMDTTNNNPTWGTPLNPYNNQYYTGGSSGGAASAVAHGLIPFAIGSDGGGSVRIPSNYCGLYGLKPTHARVSVAPMPDAGKSVTVRGPLASSMADLEVSYRVLAQPNPSSYPSSHFSPPKRFNGRWNRVLGVDKAWIDRADPPVQEIFQTALRYFEAELGYQIVDVSIPLLTEGQLAHAMTIMSEGAAGMRTSIYNLTAPNRVLMTLAKQTPATDFILAQRVRNILMEHLASLFRKHPGLIIVTPTTPNAGWPIDDAELSHGVTNGNMQIKNMEYVWLANFTGIPCIQFPIGYVDGVKGHGKVPVGFSGQGEWGSEDALIELGFDGEKWLHEGYNGGKVMPEGWVDVLRLR